MGLVQAAQPLRMLSLRFTLRSRGIRFPGFSGSIWHGGIGQMLAKASPQAFATLYQTEPESRLYAILPPAEAEYPAGAIFELRMTLFGAGIECALAVAQAIAELGMIGLRPGGSYDVIAISHLSPESEVRFFTTEQGFITLPQAHDLADWLHEEPAPGAHSTVRLITPLRIKEGGELLRTAPCYAQLMRRVMSRIDQLAHAAQADTPLPKSERAALFAEAEAVNIASANVFPFTIERRSARSGQQMQFEGLTGQVDYQGDMRRSLPWLRLAELIQVGGKTAFGFGGIEIEILNSAGN